MAKATITCTCPECGTTFTWSVVCHNRREADNWEFYHADEATTRLCPECYRKAEAARREQERKTANAAAAAKAGEFGFPPLTGTERQVAWATTIRQQALDKALAIVAGRTSTGMTDKGRAFVAAVIAKMSTEAKWWIDHRDEAACVLQDEIYCANWARLDDAARAAHIEKTKAAPGSTAEKEKALAKLAAFERARIAGRTYASQKAADSRIA